MMGIRRVLCGGEDVKAIVKREQHELITLALIGSVTYFLASIHTNVETNMSETSLHDDSLRLARLAKLRDQRILLGAKYQESLVNHEKLKQKMEQADSDATFFIRKLREDAIKTQLNFAAYAEEYQMHNQMQSLFLSKMMQRLPANESYALSQNNAVNGGILKHKTLPPKDSTPQLVSFSALCVFLILLSVASMTVLRFLRKFRRRRQRRAFSDNSRIKEHDITQGQSVRLRANEFYPVSVLPMMASIHRNSRRSRVNSSEMDQPFLSTVIGEYIVRQNN
jgi:hypothetical protein